MKLNTYTTQKDIDQLTSAKVKFDIACALDNIVNGFTHYALLSTTCAKSDLINEKNKVLNLWNN